MTPHFTAIADHAVLVTFADEIGKEAHILVLALDNAIAANPPLGMIEVVPALVNLMVTFNPMETDHLAVEENLRSNLDRMVVQNVTGEQRYAQICYEAPFSQDLDAVASETGLSKEAVITAHLEGDFQVLMYGFAPGYAYLSGVPERIQVPRKTAAIRDVPAGSVITAGPQCLITTLTMPTGWSIIGRSPTPILTGNQDRPFLLNVGDNLKFERIDLATFDRLNEERLHG